MKLMYVISVKVIEMVVEIYNSRSNGMDEVPKHLIDDVISPAYQDKNRS